VTGIHGLLIGVGAGVFYGVALWRSVAALQPARQQRTLLLFCGGALVRCFCVAALLTLAARSGWQSCLLALLGFFVTRLAFTAVVGLRLHLN